MWQEDKEKVQSINIHFYSTLFSLECPGSPTEALARVESFVTDSMNEKLLIPLLKEELKEALDQMHPTKAPGLDGLHVIFFQQCWDVAGDDVFAFA